MIVVAAVHKQKAVLENLVRVAKLISEKRASRLRERILLDFAPYPAERFPHAANDVLAVGLKFRNLRAQHVRLLAMLEKLAALSNPVLALDQDARELVSGLLHDEFQERQTVQNVRLNRLLEFGAGQRCLKNLGKKLAKRSMLRCTRLLAGPVLGVQKADADRLPDQIDQVFAGKLDKPRAEENVVVDVVEPDDQGCQPDFSGIRLKLHPIRMGRGRCDS